MSCNVVTTEIKPTQVAPAEPAKKVSDNIFLLQKSTNCKTGGRKDLRRGASSLAILAIMAGIDDKALRQKRGKGV